MAMGVAQVIVSSVKIGAPKQFRKLSEVCWELGQQSGCNFKNGG